jgi:DNA-binding beta-propeller fold protein YncE
MEDTAEGLVLTIASSSTYQPRGIAVDSNGNVYWTAGYAPGTGMVLEMPYGLSGNANEITIASDQFNPWGIAVGSDGSVYWTNECSSCSIMKAG